MPEQLGWEQRGRSFREQAPALCAWVHRDLSHRYSSVIREAVPQEMLELVADVSRQN